MYKKFEEKQLPPREDFFSTLKHEGITEASYEHAKKVWEVGKSSNLGDFHDLYVLCDTAIPADVFTCFRRSLKQSYNIDPINYVTLPSFAYDAALLDSKVELELMHCPEMHTLIERSVRGGFTTVVNIEFVANKKYKKNYNPEQETKYIV